MIKKIFKYLFWSAVAILFCFVIANNNRAHASSGDIKITEVFYDAVGTDTGLEWIELYNSTDLPISLTGYDLSYYGHNYIFDSFILQNKSFVTIHNNLTGANTLTDLYTGTGGSGNMGDSYGTVALFNSTTKNSSTILDFVEYGAGGKTWESAAVGADIWTAGDFVPDVVPGHSIERADINVDTNRSVDWNDQTSPLYKGQKAVEDEKVDLEDVDTIQIISIADARQKKAGTAVIVIGTVTIPPNQLSNQYFYIQDDTAGIQIYCYKKDFPELTLGDLVEVSGEIGDYYTDKRVKIDDRNNIKIIGKSESPAAKQVTIDEIGDDLVGQIVTFEGEVSSTSGSIFYLEGSGEIKINIKEQTNIDKPRMSVGDRVRIVGVVSKYKDTYQVLPFEQSGVTILTSGKLPAGGKKNLNLSKSILIFSLWKLSPKAKKRLKSLLKTLPKV